MTRDNLTKISFTVELQPLDAMWISKLFAIMDESKYLMCQDEIESEKTINEIKEIVSSYQLKTNKKAPF